MREPPTPRKIASLSNHLSQINCCAIVYITGNFSAENYVSSVLSIIYTQNLEMFLDRALDNSQIEADSIFGQKKYFRSYGGANNISLALGIALSEEFIVKLDDDCSILCIDSDINWEKNCVFFGTHALTETQRSQSSYESAFTPNTLDVITNFCHPPEPYGKLVQRKPGETWDNACYTINIDVAKVPYPVLFDAELGWSLRGEVYYREPFLTLSGIEMRHTNSIKFEHSRKYFDGNSWLLQMVSGADLVYTFAAKFSGSGADQSIYARKDRIEKFKNDINNINFDRRIINSIENMLLNITYRTDRFIEKISYVQNVWPEVCHKLDADHIREFCRLFLPHEIRNRSMR